MLHTVADFCQFIYPESRSDAFFRYYYPLLRFAQEDRQASFYHTFLLEKRDGTGRPIAAPIPALRYVQRQVVSILESGFTPPACATAYRKGVSILDNAQPHSGHPIFVRTDIRDFFGSIGFVPLFRAIDRALRRSPLVGPHRNEYRPDRPASRNYNNVLSFYFTRFCTLGGALPQGAPSSPFLSNLVFAPIDERILAYCEPREICYTRYSDDMTFSGRFSPDGLLGFLRILLAKNEWQLNEEKTHIAARGQRHSVTGVTVNEGIHAEKEYKRMIRQQMYYLTKFGVDSQLQRQAIPISPESRQTFCNRLLGKIQFVLQVEPQNTEFCLYRAQCLALINELLPALLRTESSFDPEGIAALL